ncbi:reverse transcriptase domain-containing protein [Tanacetum coccineum]
MKNRSNRCERPVTKLVEFICAHQPVSFVLVFIDNSLRIVVCSVWNLVGSIGLETDIQEKNKKKAKNKQNRARNGKAKSSQSQKVIHLKKIQLEGLKLPKPQLVVFDHLLNTFLSNLVEPPNDTRRQINRTMTELLQAPTEGYEDAIVVPEIEATNFEIKHGSGYGLKRTIVPIQTWDDLVAKFINQFFPPSKTTNLRNEITNFKQRFDESFSEAWDRFKDLL